jgi:hypothetical protein
VPILLVNVQVPLSRPARDPQGAAGGEHADRRWALHLHAQPAAAHAKQRGGRREDPPANGQPLSLTRRERGVGCSNARASLAPAEPVARSSSPAVPCSVFRAKVTPEAVTVAGRCACRYAARIRAAVAPAHPRGERYQRGVAADDLERGPLRTVIRCRDLLRARSGDGLIPQSGRTSRVAISAAGRLSGPTR